MTAVPSQILGYTYNLSRDIAIENRLKMELFAPKQLNQIESVLTTTLSYTKSHGTAIRIADPEYSKQQI